VQGGDPKVKLERSRQSARECRARKKLRSVQKTSVYYETLILYLFGIS
jgi:hypothetical protein